MRVRTAIFLALVLGACKDNVAAPAVVQNPQVPAIPAAQSASFCGPGPGTMLALESNAMAPFSASASSNGINDLNGNIRQ